MVLVYIWYHSLLHVHKFFSTPESSPKFWFGLQFWQGAPILPILAPAQHVTMEPSVCSAARCFWTGRAQCMGKDIPAYKTWPLNHNKQNVRRLCRDSVTHSLASWKIRTASSSVLAEFHKKWPYTWFRDPNVFKTWLATDLYCIIYATRESVFLSKDPWHVRLVDYSVIV